MDAAEAVEMAQVIGRSVARRHGARSHADDLTSAALERYVELAATFDPESFPGADERGYFAQRMKWACIDYLRTLNGRHASTRRRRQTVSLDAPLAGDTTTSFGDQLVDPSGDPCARWVDTDHAASAVRRLRRDLRHRRTDVHEVVVLSVLRDPTLTYADIATALGLTPSRVSQVMQEVRTLARSVNAA